MSRSGGACLAFASEFEVTYCLRDLARLEYPSYSIENVYVPFKMPVSVAKPDYASAEPAGFASIDVSSLIPVRSKFSTPQMGKGSAGGRHVSFSVKTYSLSKCEYQ